MTNEVTYNTLDLLQGKTFTEVRQEDNRQIHFINENEHIVMYHYQDCCESVYIEDVAGDVLDI